MTKRYKITSELPLYRGLLLATLFVCSMAGLTQASDNISAIDKYAWSENSGWVNFRSGFAGVTVDTNHLSGHTWLENVGWIKLGSDGIGPYQNSSPTNWGVNRDTQGNLSGFAWSEAWGWINLRPAGGGVNIDPVTKVFSGYAWGENIGWIHFASTQGATIPYRVAATSSISGNVSSDGRYAWSENMGWVNYRPTDGGMAIHTGHLTGYAWQENIGWIKLGSDAGGPYQNSTYSNWGVNRDGAGNLTGYAWSEGWGWVNFAPSGGGVAIDPVSGAFDGYAWGENIGWIHFASPPGAQVTYNVGLAFYNLSLDFSGTGSGKVVSVSPPFSCNTNCIQRIPGDASPRLSVTASEYSLFGGWSGCDSVNGTEGLLAMDRDRATSVTFNKDTMHVTRIDGPTPFFFPTIQEAYDSPASSGDTIQAWGIDLPETLIFNVSKQVSISGGYDQQYLNRSNTTTVRGLTIGKGTVMFDMIVVK
ncbi:MAG: hypothetical protein HXX11_05900 [Desulfuromonadales bacterium]|nr:hypothetical protein [Desulfuromonadales bacterium]